MDLQTYFLKVTPYNEGVITYYVAEFGVTGRFSGLQGPGGGLDFQSFGLKAVGLGFGLRIYVSLRTLSRHLRTMKLSVEHASPNPAP